jgi:hypothetical protein
VRLAGATRGGFAPIVFAIVRVVFIGSNSFAEFPMYMSTCRLADQLASEPHGWQGPGVRCVFSFD